MTQQEKNIQVKEEMMRTHLTGWREIWMSKNWTDLIATFRILGGRCVKCGGHVTSINLHFFNWDVEKVLCYKCQGKN